MFHFLSTLHNSPLMFTDLSFFVTLPSEGLFPHFLLKEVRFMQDKVGFVFCVMIEHFCFWVTHLSIFCDILSITHSLGFLRVVHQVHKAAK